MKKEIIIIFCALLILAPLSAYPKEYSLEDLYGLAFERSETIKIAEEDLYIAKREKDRAIAILFPTLSAYGNHTRYSEKKRAGTFTLQPEYTNSWGLRLDQSLSLSGRELTALGITKESIKMVKYDLDAVKEEYFLSVASAYYDVLMAKKSVEIAEANVERLTKHRDAANTRLRVGEATKTTLLRAEAELVSAQSDLIKAKNNLRLAKATLTRIVGISGDYSVKEQELGVSGKEIEDLIVSCRAGDDSGLSGQQSTIDCLKEKALSQRPEIKAMTIQKEITEDAVTYARGLYWPTLSLEGVYSKEENEPSSSFEVRERIYGIVKLNFPFFEGGLRIAEVRQAKAKLRQAEYNLSDLKHSISIEVESAYLDLITEFGVLEKLHAEVEYALDNYNAVSKQFNHGLANSVDVMDANTLLVTAERELVNAEYDYQFAVLKLKRTTGTLLKTVESRQGSAVRSVRLDSEGQGSGDDK